MTQSAPTTEVTGWKIAPRHAVFRPYGQKIALSPAILLSVWTENSVWSRTVFRPDGR